MTNSKEIKWEYIPNYENLQLNGMPYDEVFSLDSYGDEDIEIYKCKYHDSNLFLIARYIITVSYTHLSICFDISYHSSEPLLTEPFFNESANDFTNFLRSSTKEALFFFSSEISLE